VDASGQILLSLMAPLKAQSPESLSAANRYEILEPG